MKDRRSGTDRREVQPEGIFPIDGHPEGSGAANQSRRTLPGQDVACLPRTVLWLKMRTRPPVE